MSNKTVKALGLAVPFAMAAMFMAMSVQADLLEEMATDCESGLGGDFDGVDTCTVVEVQNEPFSHSVRDAGVSGLAWTLQGTKTTTITTTYVADTETTGGATEYTLNVSQITRSGSQGVDACIDHALGGLETGVLPWLNPNSNLAQTCDFCDLDTLYSSVTTGGEEVFLGWEQVVDPEVDVDFDVAGCFNPAGRNMGAEHRQCNDAVL
jgi:hypothetical protein